MNLYNIHYHYDSTPICNKDDLSLEDYNDPAYRTSEKLLLSK